ncbi:hypothetical protein [Burkholderia sp. Ac-20365]|uniref:hypothetical protein n=1 Tax=Burkholderia sp. Ac-20365 TaxID=2703897 RepID=UPI00197B5CB7|nr:hypothetical protein [Burkholderia sp. Ac-20365]MBN3761318.1 hypothetical protein [Burkholderia sp. Ac-20365]
MKKAIHGNTQTAKLRRTGTALSITGSAILGSALAFDGVGGCARLAQVYLGEHNLALGMFLAGVTCVGVGVYLAVKHRVRYASDAAPSAALAS